ncbi:hypothetical protein SPRG_21600 [Saprolegnia parasitica CBS 223.65]|uniref:Folate-Biopterin Transporter (FBT) Family n=1 Tax=Saprolegnia parasitica (strain CBS 223.65) TaxID=695850 RepID=A0A067BX57_SAPPC|nr:hypothetical protein SPRG_21600 [Saprolegnia parasitica CBS 223.65]KDO19157.1 hypothetical protein SPRG_21600 [Saprolegnia parasitica CBS 223.65]|eukprot:XP_012210127.1 hypothetical protein SPRG_21600 [Saprolegnia parasitica CBS 223.65]
MLLGWAIATTGLCIMTFSPFPAPYCDDACLAKTAAFNYDAPNSGFPFIVLSVLVGFGYVMADCAADAMVVEYAQREPAAIRGRTQTAVYTSRYMGQMLAQCSIAFLLNGPAYGGSFTFSVSPNVMYGICLVPCALIVPSTLLFLYAQREPAAIRGRTQTAVYTSRYMGQMLAQCSIAFLLNGPAYGGSFTFSVSPNVMYGICLVPCALIVPSTLLFLVEVPSTKVSFTDWVANFWGLLQKRVMWQICAFKFLNSAFSSFAATPSAPIARTWAGVEPVNDAIAGVLGSLLMSVIMAVVGKWGLSWNWRYVIALSTIGIILLDAVAVFATVWDVFRNQWFYNGVVLAEKIPDGIRFMVASYCAVEIADVGNEGATYGLVTTVGNLATPFASVFYKLADSVFAVTQTDIARDDDVVKWQVTYCFLLSYAVKLAALVWLFLLPPQKNALQRMKKTGGSSRIAGGIVVGVFCFALAFSVTTNFMSIYPATKCYRIAGGQGTVNGSCL